MFHLALRLQKAEKEDGVKLHVIPVASTHMIQQGTNEIFHFNTLEDVITRVDIFEFLLLYKLACEQAEGLKEYASVCGCQLILIFLKSNKWYDVSHDTVGG